MIHAYRGTPRAHASAWILVSADVIAAEAELANSFMALAAEYRTAQAR